MARCEPSDEEVSRFVQENPDGGNLDTIATLFGVTRQRLQQIEKRAIAKLESSYYARLALHLSSDIYHRPAGDFVCSPQHDSE